MALVYGVVCDGCGASDVISTYESLYEDKIPRNGWLSVNIYKKDGNIEGPEIHACSAQCLEVVSKKLKKISSREKTDNE